MRTSTPVVAITGGSSGLGAEMAKHFAREGWNVAIAFADNEGGARRTMESVKSHGRQGLMVQCDVGYKDEVDAFFDNVCEKLGLPELLINNAGVQTWASFLDLGEDQWDRTIRTNLKGYFLCTQKYARLCVALKRPGNVVMIGSGCNKLAFPNLVDYSASKGGIENLTKVAAIELGLHNIRVNCVAPGAIEIERTRRETPDYARAWGDAAPLGRVGTPRDVVETVGFFASQAASYITGQTLFVDGGVFTRPQWPDYE